jgi:hypothetical protein
METLLRYQGCGNTRRARELLIPEGRTIASTVLLFYTDEDQACAGFTAMFRKILTSSFNFTTSIVWCETSSPPSGKGRNEWVQEQGKYKVVLELNPLKTQILLNSYTNSVRTSQENTLRLRCKGQPVNAVQGNSRCLLWEPYGTHRHTLWAECRVLVC